MGSFELVLDNSKMLMNCFEEAPPIECVSAILKAVGEFYNLDEYNAPTVVGSTVLEDNSDATYATWDQGVSTTNIAIEIPDETIQGPLSLHLRMRVFTSDPVGFTGTGEVFISTDAEGFDEIAGFSDGSIFGYDFNIPNEAAYGITHVVVPLSLSASAWDGITYEEVAAAIDAGAYLNFNAWSWEDGDGPPTFRVYTAWLQVTCPGDLEPFTLDLPAWHVNDTGGSGDYDLVSTPDTSTEMVITTSGRIGVGYFAESDQGSIVSGNWVYMPDTPDGYVLSRATYVVVAYREADDGTYTGSPFSNYTPGTNLASPYLNAESSGTINNYPITPLPVGGYNGELEWEGNEVLTRLTNPVGSKLPCTRLWNEWSTTYNPTNDIHVAYYAIRLYYDPA